MNHKQKGINIRVRFHRIDKWLKNLWNFLGTKAMKSMVIHLKTVPQGAASCPVAPAAKDLDYKIERMEKKIKVSADFFKTQVVYDNEHRGHLRSPPGSSSILE